MWFLESSGHYKTSGSDSVSWDGITPFQTISVCLFHQFNFLSFRSCQFLSVQYFFQLISFNFISSSTFLSQISFFLFRPVFHIQPYIFSPLAFFQAHVFHIFPLSFTILFFILNTPVYVFFDLLIHLHLFQHAGLLLYHLSFTQLLETQHYKFL
jgi:hypothetical protein